MHTAMLIRGILRWIRVWSLKDGVGWQLDEFLHVEGITSEEEATLVSGSKRGRGFYTLLMSQPRPFSFFCRRARRRIAP
jgi:hypothetical protein